MKHWSNGPGIGFSKRQRWITGVMAGLGALFVGFSVIFHAHIHSRISTIAINEKQPVNVLVAIRGNAKAPAFIGFMAIVKSNSQILTVIPLSGDVPAISASGTHEPLYEAITGESPKVMTKTISVATGVPIHHYFYLSTKDLLLVMNALYYHTDHHWPKIVTPTAMLASLGYPDGSANPVGQVKLLGQIVDALPQVNPITAGSLLGLSKSSSTNLTAYQIFALANYVRGDILKLGTTSQLPHSSRRSHG